MIMNSQIPLNAKKKVYATISFSGRSAQFGQLVLKLKLSHCVPGQGLSAPGGPRISSQQAHEGGKVVRLTHPVVFTPSSQNIPLFLISVWGPRYHSG